MGVLLAAVSMRATAAFEPDTARPLFELRADHMVLDAAVAGTSVVVATQSGRVEKFDWSSGAGPQLLFAVEASAGQDVAPTPSSVAVSPSGRLVAAASSDGVLRVFSLGTPPTQPVQRFERPGVLVARFASEHELLLGDIRGELALLDLRSGREIHRRQLDYDPIYALAPSPDGRSVAVAFRSSRIQIAAVRTGETVQSLIGHRDSVYAVVWLGDEALASAGKDKRVLLWNLATPAATPRVFYAADHYITALGFDREHGLLALPLADYVVGVLRVADGRIARRLPGHTAPLRSLQFAAHGARLISAGSDARVLVWDLADIEKETAP